MSCSQKSQRYEYRRRFPLQVGQVPCGPQSSILKECVETTGVSTYDDCKNMMYSTFCTYPVLIQAMLTGVISQAGHGTMRQNRGM